MNADDIIDLRDLDDDTRTLLTAIGNVTKRSGITAHRLREIRESINQCASDFRFAKVVALEIKRIKYFFRNAKEGITLPMESSVRVPDHIPMGSLLTVHEYLQSEGLELELWRALGLEAEYRSRFGSVEQFWQSDKSLLEIYRDLSTIKKTQHEEE